MPLDILHHPLVQAVRHTAQQRGLPIRLVGGAVRDALLERAPSDFDFVVQGNPVPLARAVANALAGDFWLMDAERGTARVFVPDEPNSEASKRIVLDFARCRGNTWDDDLRDRDFSINAIGLDLADGALIDPTHGQIDLARHTLRAASDHALTDDPVRMLRAVRLAHQLDFQIAPDTLTQIRTQHASLSNTSAERARDEFLAILDGAAVVPAVRQLDDLGLLETLVPEVGAMRTCEQSPPHQFAVLAHTFWVMAALAQFMQDGALPCSTLQLEPTLLDSLRAHFRTPTANATRQAIVLLAALLHDNAKPLTRQVNAEGKTKFPQHEAVGAPIAAARAQMLKLSSDEVQRVQTIARHHGHANAMLKRADNQPGAISAHEVYAFMRVAGSCAPELALFAAADCYGKRGDATQPADCAPNLELTQALLKRYFEHYAAEVAPPPLLTGKDLLALGWPAGKEIGRVLEAVREAQMTGELHTRADALQRIQHIQQFLAPGGPDRSNRHAS